MTLQLVLVCPGWNLAEQNWPPLLHGQFFCIAPSLALAGHLFCLALTDEGGSWFWSEGPADIDVCGAREITIKFSLLLPGFLMVLEYRVGKQPFL